MYAKTPRHAGRYSPARDVTLALAGSGSGRHRRTATARPGEITLADLLEPVVPAAGFPGFHLPAETSLTHALDALAAEHHVRDLRPLPWEMTR